MTTARLFHFFPIIAHWAARAGGVLCCLLLLVCGGGGIAHSEDALIRISRALATGSLPPAGETAPEWSFTEETMPDWQLLEKGLELGLFPARFGGIAFEVVVLRIDPASFAFSVCTVSQSGQAFSLGEWAQRHGLVAVINASMYLPDGMTSTGYLRVGETVNNGRIAGKFGAFFVADPMKPDTPPKAGEDQTRSGNVAGAAVSGTTSVGAEMGGENAGRSVLDAVSAAGGEKKTPPRVLPEADLLDRTVDDWEALLPRYRMVVQNYRLISSDRRLLWTPGGPRHSIAAIGKDGAGRILFFLCREPLTGVEFGNLLLELPVDVHVVMYAEGGSQAGLFLDTAARRQVWMGRYFTDIWTSGNTGAPLPNVIGIRRRS